MSQSKVGHFLIAVSRGLDFTAMTFGDVRRQADELIGGAGKGLITPPLQKRSSRSTSILNALHKAMNVTET